MNIKSKSLLLVLILAFILIIGVYKIWAGFGDGLSQNRFIANHPKYLIGGCIRVKFKTNTTKEQAQTLFSGLNITPSASEYSKLDGTTTIPLMLSVHAGSEKSITNTLKSSLIVENASQCSVVEYPQ